MRRRRLPVLMFVVVATTLIGATLAMYATDLFRDAELSTVDARFALRGERGAPRAVVVVAIDAATFENLHRRFPFPRRLHAQVIDRLRAAGAKAIAYDVQFTEPTDTANDNALVEAVGRAGGVVLAATEVGRDGQTNVLGGEDVLRSVGARAASAQLPNDPGGVLRRLPDSVDGLRGFAVTTAERYSRRKIDVPGGTQWIDYAGPPRTVRTYSFSKVLRGQVPASELRGKAVVVGATAPSLQDVHPTSASGDDLMAGPEIQANAVDTVLRGFPLQEVPGALNVLLIVLLGLVAPVTAFRFGPLWSALAAAGAGVLFLLGAYLAFAGGEIVAVVYPLIALGLGTVGGLAVALAVGAFERERVRDLFARFVPETVVDEVLAGADHDLRLGGQRKIVTVLFSDVRGFTTFSETRPPSDVLDVLNRYLTLMSDVVLDHGGTLISYTGDGIMAAFGAPIDQPDHADRAVAAAREMAGPALERFNRELRESGVHDGFEVGIGLNSGPVMAGNIGSQRRLEYTTIGDTTNSAARLEGMTKGSGHAIFIADSTRSMLVRHVPDLVHVDDLEVRGRQARISVWTVGENAPS